MEKIDVKMDNVEFLRTLAYLIASLASNSWRSHTCRGGGTKTRARVEDRRFAARARYPAPAVGLPPPLGSRASG